MAEQVSDTELDTITSKRPTTKPKAKAPAKKAPAKKAPAKKASAKKAPAKKAPAKKADGPVTRNKNGESGWLQKELLSICEDYVAGKVKVEDNKPLTPHRLAVLVKERGNPEPSSGAVAACLDRWSNIGFALLTEKPKAFKNFTAAGKKKGLEAMIEAHRKAAWAARKGS